MDPIQEQIIKLITELRNFKREAATKEELKVVDDKVEDLSLYIETLATKEEVDQSTAYIIETILKRLGEINCENGIDIDFPEIYDYDRLLKQIDMLEKSVSSLQFDLQTTNQSINELRVIVEELQNNNSSDVTPDDLLKMKEIILQEVDQKMEEYAKVEDFNSLELKIIEMSKTINEVNERIEEQSINHVALDNRVTELETKPRFIVEFI